MRDFFIEPIFFYDFCQNFRMSVNTNVSVVTEEFISQFKAIAGDDAVFSDEETMSYYAKDETENLFFLPGVVIKPRNTLQVSNIMKICYEHAIPVTARGAGTGLSGGALAHKGGIVISFEKMNSIIEIDEANLQVIAEPGVITEVLQNAVKEKGLFYPPDPSSRGTCFIGGNVAENSGGPRAVKYGVVKDYVLNLEVVLANGDIMWTGANVLKNATGYNLTQLVVGSEGTLALVTKIVLKLIPHPKHDLLMLVPFNNLEHAGEAVSAIFRAGFNPSAMELVEADALRIVSKFVDNTTIEIGDDIAAHLIIETDGNNEEVLREEMMGIAEVLEKYDCGEILFADDAQQKESLWKMRRRTAEAVKINGYTIEEDTVVPRANLPKLIRGVKRLGREYDFDVVCYGHAGDGNLHIRIKKEGAVYSLNNEKVIPALKALFALVKELGGTISGEHGIGLVQKEYMPLMFGAAEMNLMKGIKKVFDPKNILNPGKIFDL